MDLTPAEIAGLRAQIGKDTIAARVSGKPVVEVIIDGGPSTG